MAGRGSSDLELMKERARRERENQARQLQLKLAKEEIPSGESDLFAAPVRAKDVGGDRISMQAQKALGQFPGSEFMNMMKNSNRMSLFGVDEQPMTPLPTQRHENPLASASKGEVVRKDLFKEKKHVTYGDYLRQKQKQETPVSSAHRSTTSSTVQNKSESSTKESRSLPSGHEKLSHDKSHDRLQTAPRKSSKERPVAVQSANASRPHSKPQNQVGDQHNTTKPHSNNGVSRSPSPFKKTPTISTTPKQEELHRAKNNHHETISSKTTKDAPHPRNGIVPMVNGAAKHLLRPKHPPLAKLDIKEAQQNQVENTDVESILKEMTVCAPLTAIQTPRKEEAKFPFPATSPIKNHIVESVHHQTRNEEPKDIITPHKVNDIPSENRCKSEKEKTKESQEVTPNVPRPRAKPTAPSGGGGGANAPMKEPRSTSPASSDSDDSSDNENDSSGDSNDDSSSSSSEEESDKEEVVRPSPRQPISPLISPPAKPNESKNSSTSSNSSWALESFINNINTQSPITPLSTSGGSRGSDKKNRDLLSPPQDENDEMLSKFIKNKFIDKDDSPSDTSHHSDRPSTHTPTSASIKSSKSATPKSPRVSQPSHNAHKSHDKKHERTSNSSLPSGRKSSHSSEGSSSHKSQTGESRTPQKDFKSSTPNSKSSKHRSSNFKSPIKQTLTDSEESDVDIESVTPGKEATQKVLLEKALEKADVTKRLSFGAERSTKSESAVKSESVVKNESVVKSESVAKSERVVKSESTPKNRNVSKPSSKSKERTKEKPRKQRTSTEEKKSSSSLSCDIKKEDSFVNLNGSENESMEKDVRNIFNEIGSEHHLLSPIPDLKSTSSHRTSTKSVFEEPKCLSYKNGKPSLMVHLKLSLLPKPCDILLPPKKEFKTETLVISPIKERIALPQNSVIGDVSDDNTTEYGDSDMDIDSPDSTFRIETSQPPENAIKRDYIPADSMLTPSLENRLNSPTLSSHSSPRHRKSFKRKQDSDRTDDVKRPKSLSMPYSKEIESPQKEKESHKDSRNWDRKHPQRSEVKVRRDSSSSVSSQSGSTVVKTKTQGTGPEEPEVIKSEVKVNDLEDKVEDLVVHDQNGARFPATNGYPSSNEMQNWLREGDRDGDESIHSPRYPKHHRQRLEERLESADTYLAEAKKLKHQADNLNDKPAKTLTYLEAVLSFIQCGYAMEKEALSDIQKIHKMYMETYRLISYIFRSRSSHDFNHNMTRKERILAVLSLRIQSLLSLKLFKLRKTDTLKLKRAIDEHNKPSSKPPPTHAPSPHQSNWNGRSTVTPSHTSPTPSPAGSIGSVDSQGSDLIPSKHPNGNAASCVSMSSPAPGMVSVPQRIHSLTQQYLNMTNFLVQCHDYWDQADTAMLEYQEFFEELDGDCGPLSLHSGILDLVFYVQTGLKKLKEV